MGFATPKMTRKFDKILGTRIDSTELVEVLARLAKVIKEGKKTVLVTLNPYIIALSLGDLALKRAINGSDFVVADGVGVIMAKKFLAVKPPTGFPIIREVSIFLLGLWVGFSEVFSKKKGDGKPIKGRELFLKLCALANENKWKVFLLGGKGNEAEETVQKLQKKYKRIKFAFDSGPILDANGEPVTKNSIKTYKDVLNRINQFSPEILFVAFGAPKQEKWIATNRLKLKAKCIMAVGGTFRYISGSSRLPPALLAKLGLEWLWRLITEPWRIKRIVISVIVFPLLVCLEKIKQR